MGSAESALPFYDLSRQYEIIGGTWADSELGNSTSLYVASAPFYWFFGKIQGFGVSGVIIEAFIFWLAITTAGISIYYLIKLLFPKIGNRAALVSSFLYLFNPFTIVNVWQRFLYNYILFIALLPLSTYLFIKGIKKRNYIYALLAPLSMVLFSFALTSLVFNVLLWFVFGYVVLVFFLGYKTKRIFLIKYSILTFVAYVLLNFWWINQFLSFFQSDLFSTSVGQFFTTSGNLSNLDVLSRSLGNITNIVRLLHGTFFEGEISWGLLFSNPISDAIMFVVPGTIFWVMYKYRKDKKIFSLSVFYLLLIFLTKGSEGPFAEIYRRMFVNIPYLQMFRNPFEKFGFILVLVSVLLFSFGVDNIINSSRKTIRLLLYLLLSITATLFLFPLLTGLVFTHEDYSDPGKVVSYETQVPKYYEEANEWLLKQGNNFRLLFLPIGQEGITYTWDKPYSGVELSNSLMAIPSISHSTTIPYYYDISRSLENILLNNPDLSGEMLNRLNVKYLVARDDIDWRFRDTRNPEHVKEYLLSSGFSMVKQFGNLEVWENLSWKDKRIYSTTDVLEVFPSFATDDYLIVPHSSTIVDLIENSGDSSMIIHPTAEFFVRQITNTGLSDEQNIFPYVRHLPGDLLYKPILIKERIEKLALDNEGSVAERSILMLGKRIKEVEKTLEIGGNVNNAIVSLELYEKDLPQLKQVIYELNALPTVNKRSWKQEETLKTLTIHKNALDQLKAKTADSNLRDQIDKTVGKLDLLMKETLIIPKFGYLSNEKLPIRERNTYQINVPKAGYYQPLINISGWENYYDVQEDGIITMQIDDVIKDIKPIGNIKDYVMFERLYFDEGIHEFGLNTPENKKNLVDIDVTSEIRLQVEHGRTELSYDIFNHEAGAVYEISFNYWIKMGSGFTLSLAHDNDRVILGESVSKFTKYFGPDSYNFGERRFSDSVSTSLSGDHAQIVFATAPWNDCENIYQSSGIEKCDIEMFRQKYDRATEVIIKNMSITRVLDTEVLLLATKSEEKYKTPIIEYEQVDHTEFRIDVSGSQGQFNLILTETFNSGWVLEHVGGGSDNVGRHFLADGYANGWIIDKSGDYKLKLYFEPEKRYKTGKYISLVSLVVVLLLISTMTVYRSFRSNDN